MLAQGVKHNAVLASFAASDVVQLAGLLSSTVLSQVEGATSGLVPARRTAGDDTLGRDLLDDVTDQTVREAVGVSKLLQTGHPRGGEINHRALANRK